MGTDIHLWAQSRGRYLSGGVERVGEWERVNPPPKFRALPWEVQDGKKALDEVDGREAAQWALRWYDARNYRVFAMLADVRNGFGFAGCPTGDRIEPIAGARGWPDDLGDLAWVARADEDYHIADGDVYPGDHTASWLTLRELDAYDWTAGSRRCGVISFEQFAQRKLTGETGQPDYWCGATSGPGIFTIEQDAAEEQWANTGALVAPEGGQGHVRIWWGMNRAEMAGEFYTRVLPGLRALLRPDEGWRVTPDDVRIVFNFDS